MPLSKIHAPKTLADDLCLEIAEHLHRSLVQTCGVHEDDNFCLVAKYAEAERILHPSFLGARDPSRTIVVEVTLLAGRSEDQKEALYQDFRNRAHRTGFDPANIIIFLVENSAVDWSFSSAGSVKSVLDL